VSGIESAIVAGSVPKGQHHDDWNQQQPPDSSRLRGHQEGRPRERHLARNRCRVAPPRRQGLWRDAQFHPAFARSRAGYSRDRAEARAASWHSHAWATCVLRNGHAASMDSTTANAMSAKVGKFGSIRQ